MPVRNPSVIEEALSDDALRLAYPLTYKPWFDKFAKLLAKGEEKPMIKRLELDEMGLKAWSMINGRNTVKDIIDAFVAAYDLLPKEAEYSVTAFIKELGKRGIVILR